MSKLEDEPGAEDRFLSGVRKALETPRKLHRTWKKIRRANKNGVGGVLARAPRATTTSMVLPWRAN
jgi:hypothetical protein